MKDKIEETPSDSNKKKKKNENGLKELWGNMKCNNTHIIRIAEGEEREHEKESLLEEIRTENFSNLVMESCRFRSMESSK